MRIRKDTALEALRRYLETEGLAHGDRLPTERDLARILGCSRETLRSALGILEAEGEVWRHVGQGTFRGSRPVGAPMRDTILLEATSPLDLMDARRLLEPQVAAAAACRCSEADADFLRRKAEDGRRAQGRAACERADDAFHQSIAEVTRNPVLIGLLRHFSSTRCRSVWQREWDRTYRRVGVEEFTGTHSIQHQAIVDAIVAHDSDAARCAMARHLEDVSRAMADTTRPETIKP